MLISIGNLHYFWCGVTDSGRTQLQAGLGRPQSARTGVNGFLARGLGFWTAGAEVGINEFFRGDELLAAPKRHNLPIRPGCDK